ncbi:uncharacterized protein LOC111301095 [Durio zibethinus]|uniref:Uncharacterized protein LOC111301095 n=1 Tax=Durio zibethinus TaxID=66656 RepID=A0A6P5ZHW1_DURZI|nr:uncharacterized protein LOC111301095 [Durio zibethinus]
MQSDLMNQSVWKTNPKNEIHRKIPTLSSHAFHICTWAYSDFWFLSISKFVGSTNRYSVRSVSFPARSHPSTLKMEEELHKLRSWQGASSSNAQTLCTGLFGLAELYICIEDLLNLPLIQQALAQRHNKKWDNEDAILSMKQSARELQSALRRSKGGELTIESNISAYSCSRKTMKKEIANSRIIEANRYHIQGLSPRSKLDHCLHLSFPLLFLSPSFFKPKRSKWSMVSKLVRKGLTACVDVAVSNLLLQQRSEHDSEEKKIQCAQVKLESLDAIFEGFEDGLECLLRSLIHTRVSLLNILSH